VLRGRLGAFEKNTLDTNVNSLSVALENVTASESTIRDADFAAETAALTRAQILTQAGTSVLATANSTPQSVLSLLQGLMTRGDGGVGVQRGAGRPAPAVRPISEREARRDPAVPHAHLCRRCPPPADRAGRPSADRAHAPTPHDLPARIIFARVPPLFPPALAPAPGVSSDKNSTGPLRPPLPAWRLGEGAHRL
jgi:hypothetical protein